jgi:hypothetical protein
LINTATIKMSELNKRKASVVHGDILGGRKHPISYHIKHAFNETVEVFEALFKLQFREAHLELQQVIFGYSMWLYQITGVDFYLWGCNDTVEEFYNRRKVWLEIFRLYDLEFKSEYLDDGSNFRRPHKIKEAMRRAGFHINNMLAGSLSRKYTMLNPPK